MLRPPPTMLVALSLLLLVPWARGQQQQEYDDCVQARSAFEADHPEMKQAYDSSKGNLNVMAYNRSGMTMKQSYPDDYTQRYRDACEPAGGIFLLFTGVLDCTTKSNTSQALIYENSANCLPPGPECEYYTTTVSGESSSSSSMGAVVANWQLDTQASFGDVCALREGSLKNIEDALPPSTAPMPKGEPNFRTSDPEYNDERRKQCMDAFSAFFGEDDKEDTPLNQARSLLAELHQLETIQESPILTQREFVTAQENTDALMDRYRQVCQDSGGSFDVFTGVLDCVSGSTNAKTTSVVEDVGCFPATGCEGYSLARWKLDWMRYLGQSCTIRSVPSLNTAIISDRQTLILTAPFVAVLVVIGTVVSAFGIVAERRQRQEQDRILQEGWPNLSLSNSEDEAAAEVGRIELPSIL